MPSIKTTLGALAELSRTREQLEAARSELRTMANLPAAMRDEHDTHFAQQIARIDEQKAETLRDLVRFPPQHDRHFDKLEKFFAKGTYDKSVFIMTKYPVAKPKAKKPTDEQLQAVIDAVRAAVIASSCIPRLASDGSAHGLLWDHIELYLLGCRRGIAIVEDKYRAELNPNVAME